MPVEVCASLGSGTLNPASPGVASFLAQPRDVAVSASGSVICVTDVEWHQVMVRCHAAHMVLVSNHPCIVPGICVQMFSGGDGALLRRLGHHGDRGYSSDAAPGTGKLHHPWGVALSGDGDLVAVTDSFTNVVQLYSAHDGRYLATFGKGKGGGPGYFSRPAGVQFDSKGSLFVADSGNHRVQVPWGR